MTREEAIEELEWDEYFESNLKKKEAYSMAIKALKQEPKAKKVIKMRDATPEERESIDKYIKSISTTGVDFCDLEPCEDAVSRQAVFEAFEEWVNSREDWNEHPVWFARSLVSLPSVTPTHTETVTEFADKCRECGARYGRYKDFCEFVAKIVLRDDFEENAGANAEILCRELSKLGIVKADEDEWVLVEMDGEDERQ